MSENDNILQPIDQIMAHEWAHRLEIVPVVHRPIIGPCANLKETSGKNTRTLHN